MVIALSATGHLGHYRCGALFAEVRTKIAAIITNHMQINDLFYGKTFTTAASASDVGVVELEGFVDAFATIIQFNTVD